MQSGWSSLASGLQSVVQGAASCEEQSWWGDVKSWVTNTIESIFPEVKVVEGAYQIIVNGENLLRVLESSYHDCSADQYYQCGEDLGGLAAQLKNDGVLVQKLGNGSSGSDHTATIAGGKSVKWRIY